jgi:lysophospholipase L1-like esterase
MRRQGEGIVIRRVVVFSLVAVALSVPSATVAAAAPSLPSSMAAIGDSITRATDVCCWYGDHPPESWSTGGGLFDGITSHYERLLVLNASIYGHNYNDARAGAKMKDAEAQAQAAVAQGARYVTILMGGNDACTSSPSTMTSVSVFRSEFVATMNVLAAGLPAGSHVFVASIPNIYRLWQLFHGNLAAQLVWSVAQICQSMLSPANTEQARQAVLAREEMFNQVLADVCAAPAYHEMCRFDDDALFDHQFTTSEVSKLDYFHPSLAGQATLASLTWQHSWWSTP